MKMVVPVVAVALLIVVLLSHRVCANRELTAND